MSVQPNVFDKVHVVRDLSWSARTASDVSQDITDLISMAGSLLCAHWRYWCQETQKYASTYYTMLGLCHRITRDHGFLNGWLNRAEVMALEHLGPDLQCDGKMSPCYVPGHVPCHCPLFHSWLQGSIGVLSEIAITSSPTERASIED